jgi:hypothetical protein
VSDSGSPRRGSPLAWIVGALLVAAIAVALVVVVRNARRVRPPKPQVLLGAVVGDTTLSRFPRTMRTRVRRLEERFARYRDTVPDLTPTQDSLAEECSAGFAAVGEGLAGLDTLRGAQVRARAARAIRGRYNRLRDAVNDFTRSAREFIPEPDLDSLDVELRRLLDE